MCHRQARDGPDKSHSPGCMAESFCERSISPGLGCTRRGMITLTLPVCNEHQETRLLRAAFYPMKDSVLRNRNKSAIQWTRPPARIPESVTWLIRHDRFTGSRGGGGTNRGEDLTRCHPDQSTRFCPMGSSTCQISGADRHSLGMSIGRGCDRWSIPQWVGK